MWGWKWRFEKYILGCDCWLKICLTSRSMSSSMISWLRRAPLGTGHTLTTSPEPNTNILTYFSQKTRSLETVVQFSLSIDSKLTRYWADFHPDLTPTLADCLCEDHRPWKRFSGKLNRLMNCTCFCHHPQFDFYKGKINSRAPRKTFFDETIVYWNRIQNDRFFARRSEMSLNENGQNKVD